MRVALLGGLVVETRSRTTNARDFPGIKPKQLFEILAVERGKAVSKARLADLLWGESLPQNYPGTLESYVSILRRTLQPDVKARESIILTERGGYRLDVDRATLDVEEFDALVASAAGMEPVHALATYRKALSLVRGSVLEDEPYATYAEPMRATYQQRHVSALVNSARLSMITGETLAALELAEQAVAVDPLAEAAYQVLMTTSYSLFRQEDALRAFDRCRRLLADELGVDPLDETVALHLAILRHEDIAALLPHAAAATTTHGVTIVPEPATDLPFLGRATESARLERTITTALHGRFTVICVTGEMGVGKTRLVQSVLQRMGVPAGVNRCSDLESDLPYVALSLALRPILQTSDGDPMPVLAELLRRSEQAHPFDEIARIRVMESLAEELRAHEPFVLVLDDAQWADAATITTLNYLHRRSPDAPVAVVLAGEPEAIRRGPLSRLRAETRIDLDVLSVEDLAGVGGPDMHEQTGGHPLYVAGALEAARLQLATEFPPELRERVLGRCWDLGPQTYRVATVAAVLPAPFLGWTLSHVVGAAHGVAAELDRLVEHGTLVEVGPGFEFKHQAERRLLAESFSEVRRAALLREASRVPPEPVLGNLPSASAATGDYPAYLSGAAFNSAEGQERRAVAEG
ncbi:MAG TPA: BTAD domain-containing putative transcriptional regulator [Dermatophilaceae bacterium]|nr:BTAD domain-containing putative transcriptional regulator [Dermatophilaceae bacterium]